MSFVQKNIDFLRKSLGLTQEQFAQIIGVSESTISKYKKNREPNDYSILDSISSFFGITPEQLTSHDFSTSNISLPRKIKLYRIMQLVPFLYPYVNASESTVENDGDFNHAYKLQKEAEYNAIHYFYDSNITSRNGSLLFEALDAYMNSISVHNNLASCINILGIILQLWYASYNTKAEMPKFSNYEIFFVNLLRIKQPIAKISTTKWSKEQTEFFSTFNDLYLSIINELKSTKFYDIADFYLAARYFYGMVDSNYNLNMLQTIGTEMLFTLGQVGNQYAISFFEKTSDLLE